MVFANFFARLLRRGHEESLNEVSPLIVQIFHIAVNGASWFLFLQTFFLYYNEAVNQGSYSTQWLANLLIASKLPLFLAWLGFLMLLFAPKTAARFFSCGRMTSTLESPNGSNLEAGGDDMVVDLKKQQRPLRMYLNARIISPTYTIAGVSATTFCGLVILGSVFDLYALRYLPWNRSLQTKSLRAFPTKSMVRLCLYSTALSAALQAFASLAIFVEQDQKSLTGAFFIGLSLISAVIVALDVLMLMVMSSVSLQDMTHHKEKVPEVLEEIVTLLELHDDYQERERFFSMAGWSEQQTNTSSFSSTSTLSLHSTPSSLSASAKFSLHPSSPLFITFSSIVASTSPAQSNSLFGKSTNRNNRSSNVELSSTMQLMLSTARKLQLRGHSSGRHLQEHYQRLIFPNKKKDNSPGDTNNHAAQEEQMEEDVLQLMSLATAQLNHDLPLQSHAMIALDYWYKHDDREIVTLLTVLAQQDDDQAQLSSGTTSSPPIPRDDKRLDVQFYRNILEEANINNVPHYRSWALLQEEASTLLLDCCTTSSFHAEPSSGAVTALSPLHTSASVDAHSVSAIGSETASSSAAAINAGAGGAILPSPEGNKSKEELQGEKIKAFEDLLITISFHPVFRAEVRLSTLVWERQEHIFLRACFLQTLSFIPSIMSFADADLGNKSFVDSLISAFFPAKSKQETETEQYYRQRARQLQHASEVVVAMSPWRMFYFLWSQTSHSSSYPYRLAARIADRPALWLVRLSPRMIDCLLTVSDLTSSQGKFNPFSAVHQDLDLVELAAIYFALPDHFTPEYDLDGKKQRWKARLLTHLRHRLRMQRDDLLSHLKHEHQRHKNNKNKESKKKTTLAQGALKSVRRSLFAIGVADNDYNDDDDDNNNGSEFDDESANDVESLSSNNISSKTNESDPSRGTIQVEDNDISDSYFSKAGTFFDPARLTTCSTTTGLAPSTIKDSAGTSKKSQSGKRRKKKLRVQISAQLRNPVYKIWPETHGPHALLPDWLLLSLEEADAEHKLYDQVEEEYDDDDDDGQGGFLDGDVGETQRRREESRDLLLRDRILSSSGWYTYQSPYSLQPQQQQRRLSQSLVNTPATVASRNSKARRSLAHERTLSTESSGMFSDISLRFSDIYALARPSTHFPQQHQHPQQPRVSEIEMDSTVRTNPMSSSSKRNDTTNDSAQMNTCSNTDNNSSHPITDRNPALNAGVAPAVNPLAMPNKRRPSQLNAAAIVNNDTTCSTDKDGL
jgi:hypothetical protein